MNKVFLFSIFIQCLLLQPSSSINHQFDTKVKKVSAPENSSNISLVCGPLIYNSTVPNFIWSFAPHTSSSPNTNQTTTSPTNNQMIIFFNSINLHALNGLSVEMSNHTAKSIWSTLKIKRLTNKKTGIYQCDAVITHGLVISKQFQVKIFSSPIIEEFDKTVIIVNQNDSLIVKCSTRSGVPKPIVYWQKLRRSSQHKPKPINHNYSNLLKIKQAQPHHSGVYECVATNKVTIDDHRNLTILVKYPPITSISHNELWLPDAAPLKITCFVTAYPEARVNWLLNRKQVPTQITVLVEQSTLAEKSSTLAIPADKLFSGNYECVAFNEQGTSNASIKINAKPAYVRSLNKKNVSKYADACVLKWSLNSGTTRHFYTLQTRKIAKNNENVSQWTNHTFMRSLLDHQFSTNERKETFVFVNLQANSTYEWRILSENIYGFGNWSNVYVCRTSSDENVTYANEIAPTDDRTKNWEEKQTKIDSVAEQLRARQSQNGVQAQLQSESLKIFVIITLLICDLIGLQ